MVRSGRAGNLPNNRRSIPVHPIPPAKPVPISSRSPSYKTYGQDVIVTRCSNNYGPYQFPEKLIPLMIIKALRDEPLPVYGDGMNVRDWIHVEDHCAGIVAALFEGKAGHYLQLRRRQEMMNLEVVKLILEKLGKPESLISFVTDRLGHDRRYAIDSTLRASRVKMETASQLREGIAEHSRLVSAKSIVVGGVTRAGGEVLAIGCPAESSVAWLRSILRSIANILAQSARFFAKVMHRH